MSKLTNTHSIRFKLLSIFTLFSGIIVIMVACFTWVETRTNHINDLVEYLAQASLKLNEANNAEKNFVLFETINPRFYQSKESRYSDLHTSYIEKSQDYLKAIMKFEESEIMDIRQGLKETIWALDSMKATFSLLVNLYLERGFQNEGLIGEMQLQIKYIEESAAHVDQSKILRVRKAEKNYLIYKQVKYMSHMNAAISDLRQSLIQMPNEKVRTELVKHLDSYRLNFLKVMRIEEQIGFKEDRGMKHLLAQISEITDQDLLHIEERVHARSLQIRTRLFWGILLMGAFFLLITVSTGLFVLRRLGKPIQALSDAISQSIDSQFKTEMRLKSIGSQDEIGQISRDVSYLYDRIQSYATELLQQKEEITMQAENLSRVNTDLEEQSEQITAKNFELEHQNDMIAQQRDQIEESMRNVQLLSEIGQEITHHLHVNAVVETVYLSIQKLMPASVFAIGIYNAEAHALDFYGIESNHDGIQTGQDKIQDPPVELSSWCFVNKQDVCIQNLEVAYVEYVFEKPQILTSLQSQSVIYLPLLIKGDVIGVITVHSKEKNAYSSFQLNILRNLASYTAIAIDNTKVYSQLSTQQQLLSAQAIQLQSANQEIGDKNRSIMASINYAMRMQQTILPRINTIKKHLPESFILYKPRDVVSGDFYFFSTVKVGNKELLVLAAVDCTGHGVPGAFTSMLGSSILDNIVNKRQEVDPATILTKLHQGIAYTFKQSESDNKDGMDMAICVVDLEERKLAFAGAKNPLVYIQNNEMKYVRGERFSIGGAHGNTEPVFETHIIDIEQPTTFYIYTDGYQDQFGGPQKRKLLSRKFRSLLFDIHQEDMDHQKEDLANYFNDWIAQGEQRQIDDMLVIGCHIE